MFLVLRFDCNRQVLVLRINYDLYHILLLLRCYFAQSTPAAQLEPMVTIVTGTFDAFHGVSESPPLYIFADAIISIAVIKTHEVFVMAQVQPLIVSWTHSFDMPFNTWFLIWLNYDRYLCL